MSQYLIVESGSTKTDWCLVNTDSERQFYKTNGMHPLLQTEEECIGVLENELKLNTTTPIDKVIFYGAGIRNDDSKLSVINLLSQYFSCNNVAVHSDLLAAARGTCGSEKGMVCILGTGSNSGYYNGTEIERKIPSLGYIIGDEGGGAYLGKRVLQYYFYNTMGKELSAAFEEKYGNDLGKVLDNVYRKPFANRYLAGYVTFIKEHREHFLMKQLLGYAFTDFYQRHLLNYAQSHQYPVHFVGSVAFEFRSILMELQLQYGLRTGKIVRSPLEGLCAFHEAEMQSA